jgi:hypothetical protein
MSKPGRFGPPLALRARKPAARQANPVRRRKPARAAVKPARNPRRRGPRPGAGAMQQFRQPTASGISYKAGSVSQMRPIVSKPIQHRLHGPGMRIVGRVPLAYVVLSATSGGGAVYGLFGTSGVTADMYNSAAFFLTPGNLHSTTINNIAREFQKYVFRSAKCVFAGMCPSTTPGGGVLAYFRDPTVIPLLTVNSTCAILCKATQPACTWAYTEPYCELVAKAAPDEIYYMFDNPLIATPDDTYIRQNTQGAFVACDAQNNSSVAGLQGDWYLEFDLELYGFSAAFSPFEATTSAVTTAFSRLAPPSSHSSPSYQDEQKSCPPAPIAATSSCPRTGAGRSQSLKLG